MERAKRRHAGCDGRASPLFGVVYASIAQPAGIPAGAAVHSRWLNSIANVPRTLRGCDGCCTAFACKITRDADRDSAAKARSRPLWADPVTTFPGLFITMDEARFLMCLICPQRVELIHQTDINPTM